MKEDSADYSDRYDFDESGQDLRRWLCQYGQYLEPVRASRMRGWLRDLGVQEFSFSFVLRCAGLAEIRLEMAAKVANESEKQERTGRCQLEF